MAAVGGKGRVGEFHSVCDHLDLNIELTSFRAHLHRTFRIVVDISPESGAPTARKTTFGNKTKCHQV